MRPGPYAQPPLKDGGRLGQGRYHAGPVLALSVLIERFGGEMIPNCPGRYVLRNVRDTDPPEAICRSSQVSRHRTPYARDVVVVTWLNGWGLISYERADGTWLHTVNDAEGFRRKLRALDIPCAAEVAMSSSDTSLHMNRKK